jgi:16S rRNA (guanine1207-N2)-methyltransferase
MPDTYYQFAPHEATLAGQTITFYSRPALGDLQEHLTCAHLLAEWHRASPGARVLCLHCGTGLAGMAAARQATEGQVTLVDSHVVAVQAAERALQTNQLTRAHAVLGDCAQPMHGQTFDQVLAHLPKGRATWQQTILDAAQLLRVDGTFYLAGANQSGIKSAAKYLNQVFGNTSVLGYRGGCRVLCAVKAAAPPATTPGAADDYYAWRTIEAKIGDETLTYATKPGLFAWKGLDRGTRLLLKVLQTHPLRPDDRVWDLGCGGGPLTVLVARQAHEGRVVATDVDWRAEQATMRTVVHNKLQNVEVWLGDCAEALGPHIFDAVVTNPPFHQARATTYAIAEQIIAEAARRLDPGGRLYLVANSFLQYKPMIVAAFGDAQLLADAHGFKIWHAVKP